jgi:hypothetical protein
MKKNYPRLAFTLAVGMIVSSGLWNYSHTSSTGAPAGHTGSPGDGKTCTNCHGGSVTQQTGWINSDIPASGYIPSTTYNVTATVISAGRNIFGFQASPQNNSGILQGSLTATNPSLTQLTGSGKYITHTKTGTSGSNGTHTWTFQWTAPAPGKGDVTFYGAFLAGNGSGSSGDIVYNSSLKVSEDLSTGVTGNIQTAGFSVYPNPSSGSFFIANRSTDDETFRILDTQGRIMETIQVGAGDRKFMSWKDKYRSGLYMIVNEKGQINRILIY